MKRSFILLATGLAVAGLSTLAQAQAPYTSATRYNVAGQVTGTMAPDPDDGGPLGFPATRNTYGLEGTPTAGLLTQTEVGQLIQWDVWSTFQTFQTRTFEYDDQGRMSAERVKGKNGTIESLVQYSYDSWDRVDCRVVRMDSGTFSSSSTPACSLASPSDRISKFTYDDLDQVLTETRALLTPLVQTYVTNTYQARGQLKTQEDAKGNLTTLEYENGRLKRRRYPQPANAHQSSLSDYNAYTYDNNGNVKTERKRNGATITYTYDANNRLTFKDLSDNANSQDISYGYDLRGLTLYSCFGATTACDESGEGETNKFDDFGNLEWRKSRMFGTTRQLFYQYDLKGNRTRITHAGGVYFTYERDGLNRVCTLGESAPAPDCDSAEADDYLAIHYSAEARRADITRPGSVTSYATDNALRLDEFTQDFALTANDLTNEFGYNHAGQVTLLTQSNTQYNYTEAQNRPGAYGVNGLNQYTSIDGTTVAYDTNGNLTADGAGMTFFYDMENRLVSTGTPASGLYYDVLGRLARVTVAGATTDFHYDGDALVGEHVVGTGQTRRYVHSGGIDEPLVQYDVASGVATKRYLHADHQGSIIAHSDNSGAVTQKNSYDPYGIPKSTNDGRFGYTGQTWLKELGLNYYKARIYSPKLGRFLQTDPIFYSAGMNMYAYAANDPGNRIDPTGLTDFDCSKGMGSGNCIGSSAVRAGDTIKVGGKTHNISATSGVSISFSTNTATSCGAPQIVSRGSDTVGAEESPEGDSAASAASSMAGYTGIAGSLLGTALPPDMKAGTNGRLYTSFPGNQHVSVGNATRFWRVLGNGATGVGIAADSARLYQGDISGGKWLANTAAGIAPFLGPLGIGYSVGYFGADLMPRAEAPGFSYSTYPSVNDVPW